jgi:hypothetical protein
MLPTKDELKERYASYPDDRLLAILYNREEYTAEALEVAQAEVESRKITDVQVKTFVTEKNEEFELQAVHQKILSWVPLQLWEKLFFFFVWFAPVFMGFAFRANYAEDGMVLKLKQSKVFAIAGFISTLLTTAIAISLDLGQTASYIVYFLMPVIFYFIELQIKYNVEQ